MFKTGQFQVKNMCYDIDTYIITYTITYIDQYVQFYIPFAPRKTNPKPADARSEIIDFKGACSRLQDYCNVKVFQTLSNFNFNEMN